MQAQRPEPSPATICLVYGAFWNDRIDGWVPNYIYGTGVTVANTVSGSNVVRVVGDPAERAFRTDDPRYGDFTIVSAEEGRRLERAQEKRLAAA